MRTAMQTSDSMYCSGKNNFTKCRCINNYQYTFTIIICRISKKCGGVAVNELSGHHRDMSLHTRMRHDAQHRTSRKLTIDKTAHTLNDTHTH